jgi:hypothetical protein
MGVNMSAGGLHKKFKRYLSRNKLIYFRRGTSRQELFMGLAIVVVGAIIITLILIKS